MFEEKLRDVAMSKSWEEDQLILMESLGPLPVGLTTLTINGDFNHSLGPLPDGLTTLNIGGDFNQPLGPLPVVLTTLNIVDHIIFFFKRKK